MTILICLCDMSCLWRPISNSQHDALKLRQELMAIWKQLSKLGCTFSHHKVIFLTLDSQTFSLTWCNLHYYYFESLCYGDACINLALTRLVRSINKYMDNGWTEKFPGEQMWSNRCYVALLAWCSASKTYARWKHCGSKSTAEKLKYIYLIKRAHGTLKRLYAMAINHPSWPFVAHNLFQEVWHHSVSIYYISWAINCGQ